MLPQWHLSVPAALPSRLVELLGRFHDPRVSEQLQAVHEAAATAIAALGELDLIQYEAQGESASADLSLWEELAPTVASTIAAVNGLVAEIEVRYPPGAGPQNLSQLLHAGVVELRQAVNGLGMAMRDPSIMGERWGLLNTVQAFRSRVRGRVGALVYDTAGLLGECRRSEVDPGWVEEVAQALAVRQGATELRARMKNRLQQVKEAPAEDVPWHVQQLKKELDAFGRSKGWLALRAPDKQAVLDFKASAERLNKPGVTQRDLELALTPFVGLTESLMAINQRSVLVEHDRELIAMCGVALEQVMGFEAAQQLDEALKTLVAALRQAKALYGRDEAFDAFLRQRLSKPLTLDDLSPTVMQLLGALGGLATL